jgi:carbonic anhydrase/acetyltransferase-like protein (isoleucine patch superfamily)
MILPYKQYRPAVHPSVYIAESADVIGRVAIAEDANVWFHAVIRGDINEIRIGARTNIQDGCILHVSDPPYSLTIGEDVTVGHGAIVHGCTISDGCLIGMGAIILDGAKLGRCSLIAAGALVKERADIPEGVLVAGVPGRIVRKLKPEERASVKETAAHYVEYARSYRSSVKGK